MSRVPENQEHRVLMRRGNPPNCHPEDHRQPKPKNNESSSPGKFHHENTKNRETDLLHSKAAKATKNRNQPQMDADVVLGFGKR
jgi:hypothetical protein